MFFLNFLGCVSFTFLGRRDFCTRRERERERVCVQESEDSAKECRETDSVLFCGGLLRISLWNISVARIKWLID